MFFHFIAYMGGVKTAQMRVYSVGGGAIKIEGPKEVVEEYRKMGSFLSTQTIILINN